MFRALNVGSSSVVHIRYDADLRTRSHFFFDSIYVYLGVQYPA